MIETRLEGLLRERGKSIYWLAEETGVAYTTLWKFSGAKTKAVYFDVLEKVCQALSCQPGDLLAFVPNKKGSKK